ncbi:MAG: DUF192 domain-containing protein [Sulfobacillus thermosulfidooxidans]|nr:DUF192 domain-containing protein [Sulfobacillus thermotolerans]POB09792.1 hypothetical protein CO251_12885 [Sulfobacillus sp. hq2]PSR36826.1 MAG: DUF192 domain-containing protein [Sulfobacillus thermosulfidooxidans]
MGNTLKRVCVRNLRSGEVVGDNIVVAQSFWQKFKGLMGTQLLKCGDGMLFPQTNSVHMFFMRYPLTVLYLSKNMTVLRHVTLKPWTIGPIVWRAHFVLELPVGKFDIQENDRLAIE